MDAHNDYLANRVKVLEDEIRELELEVHLLSCKNHNLKLELDKLMEQNSKGETDV